MVRELNAMPEEHSLKFLRWTFCLKAAFSFEMENFLDCSYNAYLGKKIWPRLDCILCRLLQQQHGIVETPEGGRRREGTARDFLIMEQVALSIQATGSLESRL